MRGYIGHLTPGKVSGWVADAAAGTGTMQVRVRLGARVLVEGPADLPRPGVGRLFGTDGRHGFRFTDLAISPGEAERLVVEARAPGAAWKPVGRRPRLRYAPRKPSRGAMRVTVIGTSHLAALRDALPPEQDRFEIINITRPRPGLSRASPEQWRDADERYRTLFTGTLDRNSHFVSMIGGNDHNTIGLIDHPRRFDLVEPGGEASEIELGRDLIPYDAMRAMLEQRLAPYLRWLAAIAPTFTGRKFHLCSPPPVPSVEHIRKFPGTFKKRLSQGVTPAPIRAKLHRMSSDIFRTGCASIGMEFLPPPSDACDADGFLKPQYWNEDPTHGNSHYGTLLLRQIEEHLAS